MTIYPKTFTSRRFRMHNRKAHLQFLKLLPALEKIWYISCEVVATNLTASGRKLKKLMT